MELGGGEGDRADGGDHTRHTWEPLPGTQCSEQVIMWMENGKLDNGFYNCELDNGTYWEELS